jgi:hypothetical protein
MAEKKITKREVLTAMLEVEGIASNEMFTEFIKHELELLEKKTANRKSAKSDETNVKLANLVFDTLAEKGTGLTASDVIKANAEFNGLSTPKMTALLKILMDEKRVVRIEDGKKVLFKAVAETEAEAEVETE